jgi:propanol-preferring alcohol dehydrogenase
VCRTDLHVLDGEVKARYPVIPGHEIVGRVLALGEGVTGFAVGQRVGVLARHTCGTCPYCTGGRQNLCDAPAFTGATRDGGYATHTVADAHFCFALPDRFSDVEAAPLLCAGLIGWRALRLAGEGRLSASTGSARRRIFWRKWRSGRGGRSTASPARRCGGAGLARSLGCAWAGGSDEMPPEPLDAALIFAPVGDLVPQALKAVRRAGAWFAPAST